MLAFSSLLGNVEGQNIYRIWYDKPASYWEEALPVGNGRIAAMVFGDPQLEQIQLNEETVSAGSPYQNYNEEAKTALPEMRRLILKESTKKRRTWRQRRFFHKWGMKCLTRQWGV